MFALQLPACSLLINRKPRWLFWFLRCYTQIQIGNVRISYLPEPPVRFVMNQKSFLVALYCIPGYQSLVVALYYIRLLVFLMHTDFFQSELFPQSFVVIKKKKNMFSFLFSYATAVIFVYFLSEEQCYLHFLQKKMKIG